MTKAVIESDVLQVAAIVGACIVFLAPFVALWVRRAREDMPCQICDGYIVREGDRMIRIFLHQHGPWPRL